jgi:hypothetical protein
MYAPPFRLNTAAASRYLQEKYGVIQTPKTLRNRRCQGTGPHWQFWGRIPYTTAPLLDEWVERMFSDAAVNRRHARGGRGSRETSPQGNKAAG